MRTLEVGFVLEHALGHATHSANLQSAIPDHPSVRPYFAPIDFELGPVAPYLPLYRSNWTVRAGLRARRAVDRMSRKTRLDALFFHTQVPAMLATDWVKRLPSIVSLDATPVQIDRLGAAYDHPSGSRLVEHLKWRLHRECFMSARHLVTWSSWTKKSLVDEYKIPADRITIVPPGVNVRSWAIERTPKSPSDPVKILFVGGDLGRKGGPDLIEAFRAVRAGRSSSDPEIELHLVTRTAVAPEPGIFAHHGLRPNDAALRALYREADIFALPTHGDCLPMAIAEAAASGLPVISTDVGAISELVLDGETGFLVRPGDPIALAAALRKLVASPALRQELGQRGKDLVWREHDVVANAAKIVDLLHRIVT